MYKHILVALDGSRLAEAVLSYVEEIAAALGSQITLAHVCPPEEGPFTHMHEIYMEHMRQGLLRKLEGRPATVDTVIMSGRPQEKILNYAESKSVDLIALTTHGRSGMGRWVLGSISDKIIRAAKTPLLIIRSQAAETAKPVGKGILLPLDGSVAGEAPLPHVEVLAPAMNREVVLLRVVEPAVFTGDIAGESATYSERLIQAEWKVAEEYLANIAQRLQNKKIATRTFVRMGAPALEITRTISELGIGLVAMSTHGRSGIARWVLGSITEKIVETADIPALIVRA